MEEGNEKTNTAIRSFTRYVEQELGTFPVFLIYAVLEWILLSILFLDGLFAFVANEFAKFFELKIPCLLCTRIDHVLVQRSSDFYYNESICEAHKKDVSSMAYCHNHKKLADIKNMCEGCLLSFATERESDCRTYKSLVGILHKDLECFVEDDRQIQLSLTDDGLQIEKSSTKKCSCCGEPLKVKSSYSKGKNSGGFSQAPAPSPRAYPYSTSRNEESRSLELPQVRYTELKFMSESDSELHEDDDGSNVHSRDTNLREKAKAASVPLSTEAEDLNDESNKTPTFARGNKFFGIPITDYATSSPRWSFRINRRSPQEKTEFTPESNEGHTPSEQEDAILNHLKRQVRLDRKSLMALYMELDEERSASAIAANNAMAMITRLQADKAAVQMEALQYQRMMEEQAEYDEDALRASNEKLLKKEEEVKALETELVIYREKYGYLMEDVIKEGKNENSEDPQEFKSQPYPYQAPPKLNEGEDNKEKSLSYHQAVSSQVDNEEGKLSEPIKDYKGGRMKKQENKTHLAESGNHVNINVDNETGSEASLTGELSSLTERVKALEADSGFLELVSKKHDSHSEGTKMLTEISQNLEKLRYLVTNDDDFEANNARSPHL